MVSRAEANRLREGQAGIRAMVERDLASYLASLDLSNPQLARSRLMRFTPDLVQTYGESAAAMAADWYEQVRVANGLPRHFQALMPDGGSYGAQSGYWSKQRAATVGTVQRAAGHLFDGDSQSFLTAVSSKAGKYALGGARETIRRSTFADPEAVGWRREVSPGACEFCEMLADRGAVYKDDTADFAAHGNCNCVAVPSWDRSAPEVSADAYAASR